MLRVLFASASCLAAISLASGPATVRAVPNALVTPGVYDNASDGFGQVFESESNYVSGVRWYIDDPTRPGDTLVNALQGQADLVLYDAANLNAPVQLERTNIQGVGGVTQGLTRFSFALPIPVVPGHQYFIAIDTADLFGLGVGQMLSSTYANGFEGRLNDGSVEFAAGGSDPVNHNAQLRDTSFEILSAFVGDLDGDGTLTNFDISAFELALTDPTAYLAAYPTRTDYAQRGDVNGNGTFDNFDIGPFETLLASGHYPGAAVPEPGSFALLAIGAAGLLFGSRDRANGRRRP